MTQRVLVAEDDTTVALLIKDGLADLGATFQVETVSSGEEVLQKIEQGKWDLVVTDQRMPGMSGLQLIETLKDKTPAMLTILITAYGSNEVAQAAQRLNVYHYMTKPFPLVDLKRVIEDALAFSQDTEPPPAPPSKELQALKITLGGKGHAGKTTLIRRPLHRQVRRRARDHDWCGFSSVRHCTQQSSRAADRVGRERTRSIRIHAAGVLSRQ